MSILDMFSLKGKVSLITGGNRGIGFAIAKAFAEAGSDIALMVRNEQRGAKACEELSLLGTTCRYFHGDVEYQADCVRVAEEVVSEFGKVDVLVNNVGDGISAPAIDMTAEQFQKVININMNSVFYMSQAVGRHMIERKSGSIINMGSISGIIANHPQTIMNYCTAKAGVHQITKNLAYEWAKDNVRVNAIAPGYIETEMTKGEQFDKYRASWTSLTPMGRFGKPYEVAGLALYLASDAGAFATGSIIVVDGGYTAV